MPVLPYLVTTLLTSFLPGSKSWRRIHSPNLFPIFSSCMNSPVSEKCRKIEDVRKAYKSDKSTVHLNDHGAGSSVLNDEHKRTISEIASSALSKPFQCRFMHRLVSYMQPNHVLELGSSLGISTAYLALGNETTKLTSVEGDPSIASVASNTFQSLNLRNIHLVVSDFDSYFKTLTDSDKFDLVFLDGHHTYDAVLENVGKILPHVHEKTILIIDDIYWSKEMNRAWRELINLPVVTQSVDAFAFGMLFFSPDFKARENHRIRLSW